MKRFAWALALAAVLLATAGPAGAGTIYTWDGGTGNWNDDAHWSGTGVPGAGDTGVVNSGTVNGPYSVAFAADLQLKGGTLNFPEYTGNWNHSIAGLYLQGGNITWNEDSNGRHVVGAIYVQADTDVTVNAAYPMMVDSTVSGDGSLVKKGTGKLILTADNVTAGLTGDLHVEAGLLDGRAGVGGVGTSFGTGNIVIDAGAAAQFFNGGDHPAFTLANQSLSGEGTFAVRTDDDLNSERGDLTVAGTTIMPGTGVGTLHIDSRKVILGTVATAATLRIEIGGASAGQYDLLQIDSEDTYGSIDNAVLTLTNCVLELSFLGGFVPGAADTFMIVENVDAPATAGRFANDDGFGHLTGAAWSADVTYAGGDGGNDIVLSNVTYVPEPATVAFLAVGGLGMAAAAARRRRRRA